MDQWEASIKSIDQWEASIKSIDQWDASIKSIDQWEASIKSIDQWEACITYQLGGSLLGKDLYGLVHAPTLGPNESFTSEIQYWFLVIKGLEEEVEV